MPCCRIFLQWYSILRRTLDYPLFFPLPSFKEGWDLLSPLQSFNIHFITFDLSLSGPYNTFTFHWKFLGHFILPLRLLVVMMMPVRCLQNRQQQQRPLLLFKFHSNVPRSCLSFIRTMANLVKAPPDTPRKVVKCAALKSRVWIFFVIWKMI